ncbi:hypothetical protein BDF22DRAFT_662808 [Syncephalis plumigaleata]|nr:hypothetical protein BDF22DRAFT_662808 [Syncephalis plumigaleata]
MLDYTLDLIKELAYDEREYIPKLEQLEECFHQLHKEAVWGPPYSLCQQLEVMRQCSAQIVQITKSINVRRIIQVAGHILHWIIISDLAYSEYIAGMVKLQYCIDQYKKKIDHHHSNNTNDTSTKSSDNINALIRIPVQRAIAYKSFLVAFTETNVAKHALLRPQFMEAMSRFASVTAILYKMDKHVEEYKKLLVIQEQIDHSNDNHGYNKSPDYIVDRTTFETRRLISETSFYGHELLDAVGQREMEQQNKALKLFVVFLFSDSIAVCKASDHNVNRRLCLFTPCVSVTSINMTPLPCTSTPHGTVWRMKLIIRNVTTIMLQTRSELKLQTWIEKFNEIQTLENTLVANRYIPTVPIVQKHLSVSLPPPCEGSELMCSIRNISLTVLSNNCLAAHVEGITCSRVVVEIRRMSDRQRRSLIVGFARQSRSVESSSGNSSPVLAPLFWEWLKPSIEVRKVGTQLTLCGRYRLDAIKPKFARILYNIIHKEQLRQLAQKQVNIVSNIATNDDIASPDNNTLQAYLLGADGWQSIGPCIFTSINCADGHVQFDIRHSGTRCPVFSTKHITPSAAVDLLSYKTLRITMSINSTTWILAFRGSDKVIYLMQKSIDSYVKYTQKITDATDVPVNDRSKDVSVEKETQLEEMFKSLMGSHRTPLLDLVLFKEPAKVYTTTTDNEAAWQWIGLGQLYVTWNSTTREKRLLCIWPECRQSFFNVRLIPRYLTVSVDATIACTAITNQMYTHTDLAIERHNYASAMGGGGGGGGGDGWPAPVFIVQLASTHLADSLKQCILQENPSVDPMDTYHASQITFTNSADASFELFDTSVFIGTPPLNSQESTKKELARYSSSSTVSAITTESSTPLVALPVKQEATVEASRTTVQSPLSYTVSTPSKQIDRPIRKSIKRKSSILKSTTLLSLSSTSTSTSYGLKTNSYHSNGNTRLGASTTWKLSLQRASSQLKPRFDLSSSNSNAIIAAVAETEAEAASSPQQLHTESSNMNASLSSIRHEQYEDVNRKTTNVQRLAQLWSTSSTSAAAAVASSENDTIASQPPLFISDARRIQSTQDVDYYYSKKRPSYSKMSSNNIRSVNEQQQQQQHNLSTVKTMTPTITTSRSMPVLDMVARFEGQSKSMVIPMTKSKPALVQPPVAHRVPDWWPILPRTVKHHNQSNTTDATSSSFASYTRRTTSPMVKERISKLKQQ